LDPKTLKKIEKKIEDPVLLLL